MDLCYTVIMDADRHIWRIWANFLQRWGLKDLVASILEAAGPLTLLGAQMVYLGQPFFNKSFLEVHFTTLARLLEDSTQTQDFVAFLREVPSQ